MILRLSGLAVVLTLLAVVPAADAKVRKPPKRVGTVIVLQQGIGDLKPGIKERQVRRLLGKPNRRHTFPDALGKQRTLFLDYRRKYGLDVLFDPQRRTTRATSIIARHRQFRTKEGLRIGATFARFQSLHPGWTCGRAASDPEQPLCSVSAPAGTFVRESKIVFKKHRVREISVARNPR